MADVFISYVEEDTAVAVQLATAIEEAGFSSWYYERDCLPGSSYLVQTGQAIASSNAVLLLVSRSSLGSNQITKEVVRAHEESKPILPVLIDVTHLEFQSRQPEWREAVGAAASVSLVHRDIQQVCAVVTRGLCALIPVEKREGTTGPEEQPPAPALPLHRAASTKDPREPDISPRPGTLEALPQYAADPDATIDAASRPCPPWLNRHMERAQSHWPGSTFISTIESPGGSEILLVQDGQRTQLVKRTPRTLVNRTAPSLDAALPGIVDEVYEQLGDDVFTLREYREGVSLDRVMQLSERPVKGALLSHWAVQLMRALALLHRRGIIHRDLSPGNVVVARDTLQPYIIDLKSAVSSSSHPAPPVGTQPYVAPEQLAGAPCFASDLYSLGMLLIYLATGMAPPTAAARLSGDPSFEAMIGTLFHPRDGTHPIREWLPMMVALDVRERFPDAEAALQNQGIDATTPEFPCGRLSLGEGVTVSMSSLGWRVEQTPR